MTFKPIEPPLDFLRKTDRTGITAGLIQRQSRPAYCRLTINPIVMEATGWADDTPLAVMVGSGADTGKVRIVALPEGLFRLQLRKLKNKMWHLNLGRWHDLPDMTAHALPCKWVRTGKGQIDIDLPDWGAGDEAAAVNSEETEPAEHDDKVEEEEPRKAAPIRGNSVAESQAKSAPGKSPAQPIAPAAAVAKTNGAEPDPDDCIRVLQALRRVGDRTHSESFEIALKPLNTASGVPIDKLPAALASLASQKKIAATPPKPGTWQWLIGLNP